jgi:hypothetical protein
MVIWIGALVPTFLVSRLLLFLTRKIGVSGPLRIILSHTVSLWVWWFSLPELALQMEGTPPGAKQS